MSLSAAVWPQFRTQVFRGGRGSLRYFWRWHQNVWNIIIGQLWTQAASECHEYGRLTLATAGLLLIYCHVSDMELGHWVAGSMGHLGHLFSLRHRVPGSSLWPSVWPGFFLF